MSNKKAAKAEIVERDNKDSNSSVMTEQFQAHMLQMFGDASNTYKPTESQVDKILALQEKGMDYTHAERTKLLPQHIMGIVLVLVALLL